MRLIRFIIQRVLNKQNILTKTCYMRVAWQRVCHHALLHAQSTTSASLFRTKHNWYNVSTCFVLKRDKTQISHDQEPQIPSWLSLIEINEAQSLPQFSFFIICHFLCTTTFFIENLNNNNYKSTTFYFYFVHSFHWLCSYILSTYLYSFVHSPPRQLFDSYFKSYKVYITWNFDFNRRRIIFIGSLYFVYFQHIVNRSAANQIHGIIM